MFYNIICGTVASSVADARFQALNTRCCKYASEDANILLILVNILNFVRRNDIFLQCGIYIIDVFTAAQKYFLGVSSLRLGPPGLYGGPFFIRRCSVPADLILPIK